MKTLNYAVRFLLRAKSYTLINLIGLSFSLACSIILLRYIHRELTVDIHCIDRDQVYGVQVIFDGNQVLSVPEIGKRDSIYIDDNAIITRSRVVLLENDYVNYQSNRISAHTLVADSAYFDLFPYHVLQGSASLEEPASVLLMDYFAKKLFDKENPIGKILKFSNGKEIKVTGVLKAPVNKRMFNFDIVLSSKLSSLWERMPLDLIRFTSEAEVMKANKVGSYPRFINSDPRSGDSRKYTFSLVSVNDMYWDQALIGKSGPDMLVSGNRSQLVILGGICLLILLAGVMNFINLYLVLMVKRGRVYSLRKVFGADAKALFKQIYIENFLLITASMIVAGLIVEVTNIPVARMFGSQLAYTAFDWILSFSILLILPLIVSIYAFVKCQRSLLAISIQKVGTDNHSARSRMTFLFLQYIITFLLVVLSLYFNKQLNFMLNTDPGFRMESVIQANMVYESRDFSVYDMETIKQRQERVSAIDQLIKSCPDIQCWTTGHLSILGPHYLANFQNAKGETVMLSQSYVTPDFFKIFDLKFVDGNLPELDADSRNRVAVVNRTALKALGYKECAEATLVDERMKKNIPDFPAQPIVAVIDDYYDGHISVGVCPMVFMVGSQLDGDLYQIYCHSGREQAVIDYLKDIQEKVYGTEDFKYSFLKNDVAELYKNDRKIASVYALFACVAIIIVCLGLFGISLFDIQQRYHEIAIRKVNGAALKDLYLLLGRKYLTVLAVAFITVIPLSWYLINEYTKDFVVKAPIGAGIFLIALLVVSIISLGTLFWQINKIASINPAEVIKNE